MADKPVAYHPTHWDASQHPRVPAGNSDGGEFTASNESVQDESYRLWRENADRVAQDPMKASEKDLRRAIGYLSAKRAGIIRNAQASGKTVDSLVLQGYDNEMAWYQRLANEKAGVVEFSSLKPAAVTAALKKAGHVSNLRHPEMGKDFNRAGYNAKQHNASTVVVHTHLDKGDTAAYVAKSKEYETTLTKAGFHVSRRPDASPEMLFVRKRKG